MLDAPDRAVVSAAVPAAVPAALADPSLYINREL